MSKSSAKNKTKAEQKADAQKELMESIFMTENYDDYIKDEEQRLLELSSMSNFEINLYAQKLENELYELSRREAKELVRGKYLHLIGNGRRKYKIK